MNKIKILIMILVFCLSVFLIIKGQIIKSHLGLLMMLIGLTGLLLELFIYNKKYV
jgi:hypothetical protein